MMRRGAPTILLILPVLFTLQAACEGRDNTGPGGSSAAHTAREAGSVEVALRIEGMT